MIWKLITSRIGLAVIGVSLALLYHYIDKAVAVRNAEEALADKTEIAALNAENDELKRRAEIAEGALEAFTEEHVAAKEAAAEAEQELEAYVASTEVNRECVVDGSVLERLRNR